jgi:hypothetical protein
MNDREFADWLRRSLDRQPVPLGLTSNVQADARPRSVTARFIGAAVPTIVIVLIAAAVFGIRMLHLNTGTVTTPPPTPSPSPSPLSESLNVGAATPVILFADPAKPNQIDGMTWDGQRSGKITEVPGAAQSVCQTTATTQVCSPPPVGGGAPPLNSAQSSNPAGTLFVAFPYFYDRSGKVVATLKGGPYSDSGVGNLFFGIWADDETHYCQVVPFFSPNLKGVPGTLQLATPGGAPHDVARVGTLSSSLNNVTAAACSVLADRAVVVEVNPNPGPDGRHSVNQYWVVQLTTGRLLWTHDLRGISNAGVVASRDGRYVGELDSKGATTIYGPTGSAVGHLTGSVQNFSWDGSLAVVYTPGDAVCHCSYGPGRVIKWSSGTVMWTGPVGQVLYASQPEPEGTNLAIETQPGNLAPHQEAYPLELYVMSATGKVVGQREATGIFPG